MVHRQHYSARGCPRSGTGSDAVDDNTDRRRSRPDPAQVGPKPLGAAFSPVSSPSRACRKDGPMSPTALDAIGRTAIVRLDHMVPAGSAEVWVKLEGHNPTASYKDRMALAMIEGAETVVEYTGGSTGSSLALVCAVGLPVAGRHLRTRSPREVGHDARLRRRARGDPQPGRDHPRPDPGRAATEPARSSRRPAATRPMSSATATWWPATGALGAEIVQQSPGSIDVYCGYVGTAACFLGVTGAVREAYPGLRRVVIEPAESAILSGGPAGTHRITSRRSLGTGIGSRSSSSRRRAERPACSRHPGPVGSA
jgi:cysteine synthase